MLAHTRMQNPDRPALELHTENLTMPGEEAVLTGTVSLSSWDFAAPFDAAGVAQTSPFMSATRSVALQLLVPRGWRRAKLCGLDVSRLHNTHSFPVRESRPMVELK